ncbi:hypothetical protein PV396_21960 [Streptomyces sp. ME02-8801-2C]|nr:hypothetical protein [Streptomyces sp. ME02-8801-2C]MDX3454578.1 hypothetical protein [Streptomyces sp. ME02-8801-2C]
MPSSAPSDSFAATTRPSRSTTAIASGAAANAPGIRPVPTATGDDVDGADDDADDDVEEVVDVDEDVEDAPELLSVTAGRT